MSLLEAEYIETGKVRYIVHPYHLGRPEIALATEAAWCAADQDRYFEYQEALYQTYDGSFNQNGLIAVANELGLDQETFTACLSGGVHQNDVENARRTAARQGVNSTPTFFINGQRFEGNQPYEQFQMAIEQALTTSSAESNDD